VTLNVFFYLIPVPFIVSDLLAVGADRNDSLKYLLIGDVTYD
jgi:hypothetical protein